MKHIIGAAVLGALGGAGCWFFGLDILPSIVVGLIVAGVMITIGVVSTPIGNGDWPMGPSLPSDGARRETSELAWALRTRSGIVDEPALERVRAIAEGALARRHLDLNNAAHRGQIERLTGRQVYALLTAGGRQRVRLSSIVATLDVLDRLERGDTAAPAVSNAARQPIPSADSHAPDRR